MYKKTIDQVEKRIAIIGGGPSGLFLFKRLVESGNKEFEITIFEKKKQLGAGMPYSHEGANGEHITNVSENEIPPLVTSVAQWVQTLPQATLVKYNIDPENFNEFKVLPRLLFGQYLAAQFDLLLADAKKAGFNVTVHYDTRVIDIVDQPGQNEVGVEVEGQQQIKFDAVVICTGHSWPLKHEGKVPGYYDTPYPPVKLKLQLNHPVAIKGSSLTAIDAIRTLARNNGKFFKNNNDKLSYILNEQSEGFNLVMHSRSGMLPAVRFHLEDARLKNKSLLTAEEIEAHIKENKGFLSLDFIFEKDFKALFLDKEPTFYERIKNLNLEQFVAEMMKLRERIPPFQLLKAEYAEAAQSIKRHESIYWKEMLGALSFAMNYPAKYLSAEDMQRLQQALMPLISIVIAYVPQSSCEELLALYDAGVLDMIAVGEESEVEPNPKGGAVYRYIDDRGQNQTVEYSTFINCVGQPHLSYTAFPFKSMLAQETISQACIRYSDAKQGAKEFAEGNREVKRGLDGEYYLNVAGIAINDSFQVIDKYGAYNPRIFMMATPYIGGFNPDYSGLDFCEEASARIVERMMEA